jgi:hypothetical protein
MNSSRLFLYGNIYQSSCQQHLVHAGLNRTILDLYTLKYFAILCRELQTVSLQFIETARCSLKRCIGRHHLQRQSALTRLAPTTAVEPHKEALLVNG